MRISTAITPLNRDELAELVRGARPGARIEFVDDPRTSGQNRLMWTLLHDLSDQLIHCGSKWEPESWKAAFLRAMGKQITFMPGLDGEGVVAVGYHSSRLSKAEMSEMIERIYEYGARHGVRFKTDPPPQFEREEP
jgi:hypothetical protein